jgi:hypothetical protein
MSTQMILEDDCGGYQIVPVGATTTLATIDGTVDGTGRKKFIKKKGKR